VSPAELQALSDDELQVRRAELAEAVNPLLMRLEMIDDVVMHRRRAAQRARILAGPVADPDEHTGDDALSMETT
jgi:hypothetical protein